MRIGVDCQALQLPGSKDRGIGIYARSVVRQLLDATSDEYHLFFSRAHDLPGGIADWDARAHVIEYLQPPEDERYRGTNEYLQRLTYENAELEILHVASAMEGEHAVIHDFPGRGYPVACTLYDLIPLRFPDPYLVDEGRRENYFRRLKLYANADILLAISETSRRDAIKLLELPEARVINVGAAASTEFRILGPAVLEALFDAAGRQLGIRRDFVLLTGGFDFRKNLERTIQGFSLLPQNFRKDLQLVIVCSLSPEQVLYLKATAEKYGVGDALVLTNFIPQDWLVALYNKCRVFVFASLYEGFGLPVLEAMCCGAPVVTSNCSSLPEVAGEAAVLVDPSDAAQICKGLARVLESAALEKELREAGAARAKLFSWDKTARKIREGFETARTDFRRTAALSGKSKPRLAYFSPLPPQRSGISDYSAELIPHLARHFEIDLYVDNYRPSGMELESVKLIELEQFRGLHERGTYYSILYQMGNSTFHAYMYKFLRCYPGITVLHDVFLHGFVYWYRVHHQKNFAAYARELTLAHGEEGQVAAEMLLQGEVDGTSVAEAFPLNQTVVQASKAVITHSDHGKNAVANHFPDTKRIAVVPMGISVPALVSGSEKQARRRKWGLPEDAIIFGTFGIIAETKQLEAALRAFAQLRKRIEKAYFVVVGEFFTAAYEQHLGHLAEELQLVNSIRFAGFVPMADFYQYLSITDVALNLRHPSHGETSASMLRSLSCGIPTIVSNTGAFADLPNEIVIKIPAGEPDPTLLAQRMLELAEDPGLRAEIGSRARDYLAERHAWDKVADAYAGVVHSVEQQGLGDQRRLRELIRHLTETGDVDTINQLIDKIAANEGSPRVVWA